MSKLFVMVSERHMCGIDSNSGGYPYRAEPIQDPQSLHGVKFWNEKELKEANEYMAHWAGKGGIFDDIRLKEFKFSVEE